MRRIKQITHTYCWCEMIDYTVIDACEGLSRETACVCTGSASPQKSARLTECGGTSGGPAPKVLQSVSNGVGHVQEGVRCKEGGR